MSLGGRPGWQYIAAGALGVSVVFAVVVVAIVGPLKEAKPAAGHTASGAAISPRTQSPTLPTPLPPTTPPVPRDTTAPSTASSTPTASNTPTAGRPTYPPTTLAEVRAFAETGDPSVIHLVRTETRPNGGCERPNYLATVQQGVTGERLAADELAFFVAKFALGGECAAFLFVFHSASEIASGVFTAGAVIMDSQLLDVFTGGVGPTPSVISVRY